MSSGVSKRSSNFTTNEISFLLSLVDGMSDIVECKQTDRTNAEKKTGAWKEIEREFNLQYSNCFRSQQVLKTKYINLKKQAKKNIADDKRRLYGTGGGPNTPAKTTSVDNTILEICHAEQFMGSQSCFDDDYEGEVEFLDDKDTHPEDAKSIQEDQSNNKIGISWEKYSPNLLKKPVHKAIKNKNETTKNQYEVNNNKESTKHVWFQVAQAKLEKAQLEIDYIKEMHILNKQKLKLEIEQLQK